MHTSSLPKAWPLSRHFGHAHTLLILSGFLFNPRALLCSLVMSLVRERAQRSSGAIPGLWTQYFNDPSKWWDNRKNKRSNRSPDFTHKTKGDSLWIDSIHNPSWVAEKLRKLPQVQEDDALKIKIELIKSPSKTLKAKKFNGKGKKKLSYLQVAPYVELLKSCAREKALQKGANVHADIQKRGFLAESSLLANTLISMYAKCGALVKAREVLDGLSSRTVVSWSALLAAYVQQGHNQEAWDCFEQMQRDGISPNEITFTCILKLCGSLGALDKGKEIHAEVKGLLQGDVVLGNALIDMYVKCGDLTSAREVLEELDNRNVISWSALIAGYAQQGCGQQALDCFERMQKDGLFANAITYTCILKACGSIGALEKGKQIHRLVAKEGLLQKDVMLGNALVDMYAKCGAFENAREVLDGLSHRDAISWSALIAGYARQGLGEEALQCFKKMRRDGFSPCAISYACVLKACGSIGALDMGEQIHDQIQEQGLLIDDVVLGNALVDMYAKCGALSKAQEVLEGLCNQDAGMWTALIAGYAWHGQGMSALECFERMERKGLCPDGSTFSCLLNACSHSGLLKQGEMYFTKMRAQYGLVPTVEHYTCMVDLYGRAGHLNKAVSVIDEMQSSDHLPIWFALLGACRKWQNVEIGRLAFEHAVQLDKHAASAYVCMSNIYEVVGRIEEANEIEFMRVKNKAWKKPGCTTWADKSGKVYSFCVGDAKHPQIKLIRAKLNEIGSKMSEQGYVPSLQWVSGDIPNEIKMNVLCGHSEKLAVACALINTPKGSIIRVVKNMRMCGDCHSATAFVSKLEDREISVRDANRFHVFKDGKCSCGDYW